MLLQFISSRAHFFVKLHLIVKQAMIVFNAANFSWCFKTDESQFKSVLAFANHHQRSEISWSPLRISALSIVIFSRTSPELFRLNNYCFTSVRPFLNIINFFFFTEYAPGPHFGCLLYKLFSFPSISVWMLCYFVDLCVASCIDAYEDCNLVDKS